MNPVPQTSRDQAAQRLGAGPAPRVVLRAVPMIHRDLVPAAGPIALEPSPLDRSIPSAAPATARVAAGLDRPLALRPAGVLAGAGLLLADAVPRLFQPLNFWITHRAVLARAAAYALVPTTTTALIHQAVPGIAEQFPVASVSGAGFVVALFLASSVVACLALAGVKGTALGARAVAQACMRRSQA